MRPIIYPYKFGSGGARNLSAGLREKGHRAKRVRPDGNYSPYRNHVIVNWGCSRRPAWQHGIGIQWLNTWMSVAHASNKLDAFRLMQAAGVQVPDFTTNAEEANAWGSMFFGRKVLQGHSGEGIIVFDPQYPAGEGGHYPAPDSGSDRCPLYVKYVKKEREYRIHVFNGRVIDIQQKRRRREVPDEQVNWQVRNYRNGFTYCRDAVDAPDNSVLDQAVRAIAALGLDFGAVDIIWNAHEARAYVLEVNTAPGLEGTTVQRYVEAIESIL